MVENNFAFLLILKAFNSNFEVYGADRKLKIGTCMVKYTSFPFSLSNIAYLQISRFWSNFLIFQHIFFDIFNSLKIWKKLNIQKNHMYVLTNTLMNNNNQQHRKKYAEHIRNEYLVLGVKKWPHSVVYVTKITR